MVCDVFIGNKKIRVSKVEDPSLKANQLLQESLSLHSISRPILHVLNLVITRTIYQVHKCLGEPGSYFKPSLFPTSSRNGCEMWQSASKVQKTLPRPTIPESLPLTQSALCPLSCHVGPFLLLLQLLLRCLILTVFFWHLINPLSSALMLLLLLSSLHIWGHLHENLVHLIPLAQPGMSQTHRISYLWSKTVGNQTVPWELIFTGITRSDPVSTLRSYSCHIA